MRKAPRRFADGAGLSRPLLELTHDNQRTAPDQTGVRHLDGRFATDRKGLHLAFSEAMTGPGGYFGRDIGELSECLDFTGFRSLGWQDEADVVTVYKY